VIITAAILVLFPLLMAYAALSDMLTMTIPNEVSLALVAGFTVVAIAGGLSVQAIAFHAGAGALVLAIAFALFAFGWIGGGDAKLVAATSLWLGFGALAEYLFITSLFGGVLTAAVLLARATPVPAFALGWEWLERLRNARSVPYGIALGASALIVYPHCEIWSLALAR
jgi:prepilin peptidase CpaA